jgi:type II secretory pathway component PulM
MGIILSCVNSFIVTKFFIFVHILNKTIITLEKAILQLEGEFSIFTVLYSDQPSHAAIEEAQENIQKLREMVTQLKNLLKKIHEFDTYQEIEEVYEHISTSVSERYISYIQSIRRLHAAESDPYRVRKWFTYKPHIPLRD